MKILVADLFSKEGMKDMENSGLTVHYDAGLSGESLAKAMAEFQPNVLVVRSTKVTKEVIDADPKLQMVVRAGAGYDTIDVAHCAALGVYVTNCPGKNAHAVAELTMGLILAIDRRLAENVQLLREGRWNKGAYAACTGIKGRTLGVVGLGSIGQLVVQRALAFEMHVVVFSRNMKAERMAEELGVQVTDDLGYLLGHSDIVTFHVPGGKETADMINKDLLA